MSLDGEARFPATKKDKELAITMKHDTAAAEPNLASPTKNPFNMESHDNEMSEM